MKVILYYDYPQQGGHREVIWMDDKTWQDEDKREEIIGHHIKAARKGFITYRPVYDFQSVIEEDSIMWRELKNQFEVQQKLMRLRFE